MSKNEKIFHKEENFDKFVFYFCVIDHLFLPYVWFVSIPYSLPVVLIWFIIRYKNLKQMKEYNAFIALIFLMVISTFYSLLVAPGYGYKNMVYLILFTAMFLYYFMFYWYLSKYNFKGNYFILAFIIFVAIFAILFNIDKSLYFKIRLFWNMRSGIGINEGMYTNFIGYRYSFIWMDANNIGYMMNSLVLYLWCNEKSNLLTKISSVIALIFILISCMSNGAFIAFGISVGLYIITTLFRKKVKVKEKKFVITPIKIVLSLIVLFILSIGISKIPEYLETSTVKESFDRIDNNSGDYRITIWKNIIKKVNFFEYLLLGKGGVILVNGEVIAPHNGHIYLILGYGFISYLIFMYLIFYKRKVTSVREYIFIIPILFGFTINILLGETKMMCIIMLLVACASSREYLTKLRSREID